MPSLLLINVAKQTCRSLVFIIERTDDEALFNTCKATITHLCNSFNITVLGSLPNYGNRVVPRNIVES